MSRRLEAAFDFYARLVESKLRSSPKKFRGKLSVIPNRDLRIRELVGQLEEEAAFHELVAATHEAFSERDSKSTHVSFWQYAVRNVLRRSGFYLAGSRSRSPHLKKYVSHYEAAFAKTEEEITYLAPMELVSFAKPRLRFEGFSIRRFSRTELARLLEAETNRVFYPWAIRDTDQLAAYWFISRSIRKALPKRLAGGTIIFADLDKVRPYRAPFPPLDSALRPLVLYRWQWDLWRHEPVETQENWMGFRVPFVLERTDDLLDSPRLAPDLRELRTSPVVDAATGEELGDEPDVAIDLDHEGTAECEKAVQYFEKLLFKLQIEEHDWQFVSVASGYLVKAFFTVGMEQLLWHITTLEALLGEKGEGIVQRVANRLAVILGETEKERKALRQQYKHLYDFRSALVHGGRFEQQVLTKHLREARDLARAVVAWVLTCLAHFLRVGRRAGGTLPTRKDLLKLLDMDEATRVRVSKALTKLPAGFPRVKEWLPW